MNEEMMPFKYFAADYIRQLCYTLGRLDSHQMHRAIEAIRCCKGMVWLIGNGGSASLASHMATDLQLAGIRAQALTDVAAITTYANDFGYAHSFRDQLFMVKPPDDILIAISGSGNSTNVNFAADYVKRRGCKVIGVTGFDGGGLQKYSTIHLHVPAQHMGRSQDGHQIILHIICYYLMERLKQHEKPHTPNQYCTCTMCLLARSEPARTRPLVSGVHGFDDHLGPRVL